MVCHSRFWGLVQRPVLLEDPLMQSLYLFHIYYTTRRILDEMKVALPEDDSWDPLSNTYDHRGYERICSEFGIPKTAD